MATTDEMRKELKISIVKNMKPLKTEERMMPWKTAP